MNVNYYNEFDKGAAAWLRELINAKLIPFGYVDERSITEVTASDVQGFTQCHFFAGIGGWSLALQLAGVPANTRLWTGSPPCQPFSTAGKQLGQFDERHLAPVFLNLVSKCRPPVLFGEQVAPAIAKSWMCDLQAHLEGESYAVGFAVLPACGVGAPHKRDRLFFGAHNLAESLCAERDRERLHGLGESNQAQRSRKTAEFTGRGDSYSVADADNTRSQRRERMRECADKQPIGPGSVESELADTPQRRRGEEREDTGRVIVGDSEEGRTTGRSAGSGNNPTNPHHGFWSYADWLGCRDGKFRPVEPGTFPLANGIPARVGRLRGYGNAIVPQVAAEFVKAFMSCEAP